MAITQTIATRTRAGHVATATTTVSGTFEVDVNGFTAPILLAVDVPASQGGGQLFGVSMEAGAGTANIHPLTSLALASFYEVRGLDLATVWAALTSTSAVPSDEELGLVRELIEHLLQLGLDAEGVRGFDMFTGSFVADGSGFDAVMGQTAVTGAGAAYTIQLTNGAATQTTTVGIDDGADTVAFQTATQGAGGALAASGGSTLVPTSAAMRAAVDEINQLLAGYAATVNARGATLDVSHLADYATADHLHFGHDRTLWAGLQASDLRGRILTTYTIHQVVAFDPAKSELHARLARREDDGSVFIHEHTFKLDPAANAWRFYGNQWPYSINATKTYAPRMQAYHSVQYTAPSPTVKDFIDMFVFDRLGAVTGATLTGKTAVANLYFDNVAAVPQAPSTVEYFPSPGVPESFVRTGYQFNPHAGPLQTLGYPAPGLEFDMAISTPGGTTTFTVYSAGSSTESPTLRVEYPVGTLVGHALSDAHLGEPLTVKWTTPGTFAVAYVELMYECTNQLGEGFEGFASPAPRPSATEGTITVPASFNGSPTETANVACDLIGIDGEVIHLGWTFQ